MLEVVCDTDSDRLQGFSKQYGVRTTAAFSDLLGDPAVDAVVLATPAERHAAMVREAMLAGKDVFVEKPLSLDSAEAGGLL